MHILIKYTHTHTQFDQCHWQNSATRMSVFRHYNGIKLTNDFHKRCLMCIFFHTKWSCVSWIAITQQKRKWKRERKKICINTKTPFTILFRGKYFFLHVTFVFNIVLCFYSFFLSVSGFIFGTPFWCKHDQIKFAENMYRNAKWKRKKTLSCVCSERFRSV